MRVRGGFKVGEGRCFPLCSVGGGPTVLPRVGGWFWWDRAGGEARWFDELAMLHAAAAYAVMAEDKTVASAVKRNTEFHLRETQADHATRQPFGLFAFIWNEETRSLADGMLHNVSSGEMDGVTRI